MDEVTIKEQASRAHDFIGRGPSVFNYDLEVPAVRGKVQGQYIIVYTRRFGPKSADTVQTFAVNIRNTILITSTLPRETSRDYAAIKAILDAGNWGAGLFKFRHRRMTLELSPDISTDHAKAGLKIENNGTGSDYSEGRFDIIMDMGASEHGSSIAFGMKEMGYEVDEGEETTYGFEFVKVVLACLSPETGEESHQLIVGVKIPREGEGDIGSGFLLKQRVRYPHPQMTTIFREQQMQQTGRKRKHK